MRDPQRVSAVTYYLDDENIEMGFQIDPYELPSSDMAEKLLSIYMQKVQKSFPALHVNSSKTNLGTTLTR